MNLGLNTVASLGSRLLDDFCGTPIPGHHGPLPGPLGSVLSKAVETALNPQPLPPGEAGGGGALGAKASWEDGDLCPPMPPFPHPHWNVLQQIGVQPEQVNAGLQQQQQM